MPDSVVQGVYARIHLLSRFAFPILYDDLPRDGIYFFFEVGESVILGGQLHNRIVRVGTHREDRRFKKRIRQHFGRVRILGGNKNHSVFRRHMGTALMRSVDKDDPRIEPWLKSDGDPDPQIEKAVSQQLRDRFSFCCVRVDSKNERLALEAELIALLAQYPANNPSRNWLGQFAAADGIRRSGLWNTQHLDSTPLSKVGLARFEKLADYPLIDQS